MTQPVTGEVAWRDLTVDNAEQVRSFYEAVVGWEHEAVSLGDYDDYSMRSSDGTTVAGICHARGSNANLPAQWLIYITVDDVQKSADACVANGGEVLDGPRSMGGGTFCVIRDPAGAVCGLYRADAGS